MLEMHSKHYNDMCEAIYKTALTELERLEKETNKCLSSIGEQLIKLNKIIKQAGKILIAKECKSIVSRKSVNHLVQFNTDLNTYFKVGFGGIVGGTAALGV